MMKKKMWIAAAAVAASVLGAAPAMAAGWQHDGVGYYYVYDSGNYASNGWRTIDGRDYYFDPNGYMAVGWRLVDYEWRYFLSDGSMAANGWQMDNGKWYYFDNKGNMKTGWLELKNKTYYLNEDGSMAIGAKEIDGQNYFFQEDGSARTGGGTMKQGDIKYRYKDKVLQRYNTVSKEWEPVPGEQEAMELIMEGLRDDYIEKRLYGSEEAFEAAAKSKLGNYLDETDLHEFTEQVEREYNEIYDIEDDYYDNYYYDFD